MLDLPKTNVIAKAAGLVLVGAAAAYVTLNLAVKAIARIKR